MKWPLAALGGILCPVFIVVLVVLVPEQSVARCVPARPAAAAGTGAEGKVQPMKAGTYTRTSGYGPREGGFHKGVDWAAEPGTPIYAAASGVVAEAGPASGFGMWVILDHNGPDGAYSTVYGHMFADGVLVATGNSVSAGQQIAAVGYNGQTVPAGPGGAHLHFELITGGTRLGGGTAVDPEPWLADAAEPGAGPAVPETPAPGTATRSPDIGVTAPVPGSAPAAAADADPPPLPPAKGSEDGLQPGAVHLARILAARFPQVQRIGGWRPAGPADPVTDHAEGRAIDIMIPNYTSGEGKALGDAVTDYVMAHAGELGVQYTIWRGIYRDSSGDTQQMTSHGNDTADHFDHVHITVTTDSSAGAGVPGGPAVGAVPGCEAALTRSGEDDLAPGSVPAEYERWYRQAGSLCPQIKASLLAAQGKQESGFDPQAQSSAGALGIAQFLPGTAAAANPDDGQPYVIDADGNGTASVWEPADAIIGQGRYMCALARKIDGWIADGSVTTHNPLELYLAAYNAGEGAVLRSGGFPAGHSDYQTQTRPYVDTILAQADQYSTALS